MIRLALICFLISMIRSYEDCNFTIDDVREVKRLFYDSEHRVEEATRGQSSNAAIVLGNARAGKSTLINYLMGNSLIGYKDLGSQIKIKKRNNNNGGPEIGAGSLSMTSFPTRYTSHRSDFSNLDIWDTAGFDDNRGYMEDLTNAFHLHHLTKRVNSLKFILVLSLTDITNANVQQVLSLLTTLDGYFDSGFVDCFPSISVIISKAPERTESRLSIDHAYLNYQLEERLITPNLSMSNASKDFLRYVTEHKETVGFFRKAAKVGALTSLDYNIIPAITNSRSLEKSSHQNIKFALSAKSSVCLHQTNINLLDMNRFLDLASDVNRKYTDDMNYLNQTFDKTLLKQKKDDFKEIYSRFDISSLRNSNVTMKIDILRRNHENFEEFIKKTDLIDKVSLIEFIDSIINSGKIVRIDILFGTIIKILFDRTALLIAYCQCKLNEISREEMEREREENKRRQQEELRRIQEEIDKTKPKEEESFWRKFFGAFADANITPLGALMMR